MFNVAASSASADAQLAGRAGWYCSKSLPILMALAAFLVDLNTPNGIVDGFLYVSAVLVCVWIPTANAAPYTALGLMLPMVLGLIASPNGASLAVALTNRGAAMAMIWLAAIAVWRNARAARAREASLIALHGQLRAAQGAAQQERVALSEWLRQEVSLELAIVDWRLNYLAHRGRRARELKSEALLLRQAIQRANHSVYGKMIRLTDGV